MQIAKRAVASPVVIAMTRIAGSLIGKIGTVQIVRTRGAAWRLPAGMTSAAFRTGKTIFMLMTTDTICLIFVVGNSRGLHIIGMILDADRTGIIIGMADFTDICRLAQISAAIVTKVG